MDKLEVSKTLSLEGWPEYCFWESEVYLKARNCRFFKKHLFKYLDHGTKFYAFFTWARRWITLVSKQYVEPYKFYPLPVSDQIMYWQPIFSKRVSDGLISLDKEVASGSQTKKKTKKYKSVMLRALFLTFWKRMLLIMFSFFVLNTSTMCLVFIVKRIIYLMVDEPDRYVLLYSLILSLAFLQFFIAIFMDHANFYMYRLIHVIQYLFSITIFQNGLCHRRRFANNINGSNQLNVCNQVLHSCSPDSECSKNPLFCQALRYQNKDINSRIFAFEFMDSYYISLFIESVIYILQFMFNFIAGFWVVKHCIPIRVWPMYVFYLSVTFLMGIVELFNTLILKYIYGLKDYRINKSREIIAGLNLIDKMCMDDIAHNIITRTRNNELMLLFLRFLLSFLNRLFVNVLTSFSVYHVLNDLVNEIIKTKDIKKFETAPLVATMTVMLKISDSMLFVPDAMKFFTYSLMSYLRAEYYMNDCSPNFYISDNRFTGSTQTSTDITSITIQIPNDVVVYYKDATFTWVNTRDDLINKNYEPLLKNINFELKRGEMAVVTGSKGAGKSNFIKSMLGEMTLVGGSMAVIPLHTSMPIFYASQDIFLQQGTIRSNIVFGHKFDDNLYNTVLKAVELEYDISTWEKGDLRVVSDNAHSLSGGQRVRVEMARAIYAYLVFHKVNKEYNNSQCSFLMCLDASFHGLDPYVSKTIFNNLFNSKTGLLVKRDLSVVLAMSKQSLDICSKTSDLTQVHNPPLYKVKNNNLIFHSNLHDFIKVNKPVNNQDYKYLSSTSNVSYEMNYLTDDMLSLCSSGFNTRLGRMEVAKEKYGKSFSSYVREELSGVKFNTYKAYMSPALGLFIIYLVITTALTVLDNIKFILSTRLSDYITKHINQHKDGQSVDLSKIKAHSKFSLNMITLLVSIIIILSFLSTVIIASSCIIVSRKLHEYCINAIFKYSSSVLKINNQLNQVITYLSCDTCVTDHVTGLYFSLLVIYLIQTLIHIITLFYLIPISIPFFILTIVVITKFLFLNFIVASKNLTLNYLETLVHINTVSERAISGSSIYRSFKREQELSSNFTENTDYYMRSLFVYRTLFVWSSILFNWIFSFTTLVVLVLPIILDRCTKYKMKVGYFGLGLSLCMNVTKTFTKLTLAVVNLEMCLISLQRVRYFIPRGETLKFDKFLNTHQEYLVNPLNKDVGDLDKKQLLRRRAVEFKADNKKFYILRKLFFNPRLTMVDIANYLPFEHSEVVLEDVSVYTTPDYNPEGILLNHFSASVCKSEIIGMVGRTGAGKTTLLSVLQNVVENRTGQVLLDGKDLNDIPKVVLRQIIGVLPQLPFVFKGWTIRRFLDPRKLFSDDEINQALNDCGLLEFVNDIPGEKKLDSVLVKEDLRSSTHNPKTGEMEMNIKSSHESFESNVALSNTQLRTLSLARLVLYRHFYRMILVDEPPEEDLVAGASGRQDDLGIPIYDLLQKYFNHCSTFVAAHDANVLKACTSVWVIYEGSLVKTCKTSEISANESIASIIEECVSLD